MQIPDHWTVEYRQRFMSIEMSLFFEKNCSLFVRILDKTINEIEFAEAIDNRVTGGFAKYSTSMRVRLLKATSKKGDLKYLLSHNITKAGLFYPAKRLLWASWRKKTAFQLRQDVVIPR